VMINKNKMYLGAALATMTMAGAMVSPQVFAVSKAERWLKQQILKLKY